MTEERTVTIDQAKSVVFLTAALVMAATWAVGATGWTKGLNSLTFVGLGVVLIGMMLARSILPGLAAHLFSLIIGLAWSFWVTSRLLPAHYTWLERWQNLVFRLNYWYSQAVQGGTSYDNLMFILQMGVIVWIMGYLMIWFVFRSQKVWLAVVPGGLVLLINLYYAPKDITSWFLFYLLLSFVLIIRFNLLKQETKWRAEGVFFRPDISFDFLRDGLIFVLLLLAVAWMTPPIVDAKSVEFLEEFQGTWRDVQAEWNRLYADLNYRETQTVGTFGPSLTLGGPRRLTDTPVMDVQVDGIGRYWRAVVYDEYTGEGWRSNDRETGSLEATPSMSLPNFEARMPITQTYTFYRDGAVVLYAMSNPISLDRSAKVRFNALSDEQVMQASELDWLGYGEPWGEEITYIRSNATVDSSESYRVVSAVSQATVEQLQAAGDEYPTWVTERYLHLPDTITQRTRQLARDLTKMYDNPYDKAAAVERYLRAEISYNERIAAPPPGVEKVDYILFSAKEAYCDYYASSMVVMLRSLGIPARMAAGYARGTFDSEMNAFHVINADAHSWVEVFFPRYGWVEFEPTSAQPVIIRSTARENNAPFAAGSQPNDGLPDGSQLLERPENIPIDEENFAAGSIPFTINLPWLGTAISVPRSMVGGGAIVVGGVILVGLIVFGLWGYRQMKEPDGDISALYRQMVRWAGWMGVARLPWQTPYEHAAVLQHNLPGYEQEVKTITDEYVRDTYSHYHGTTIEAGSAAQFSAVLERNLAWTRLRSEMLKRTIKHRWPTRLGGGS